MSKNRVFSLSMLSGSMADEVIIPFLDGLVAAGYQGVCPHPRNGLKVPYPSRLYWQRLARFIELAQERNLEIWHYDEFPYPSGQLGGLLVEDNPHMASRELFYESVDPALNAEGFIDIGRGALVALLRYRQDDKSTFDIRDVTADTGSYIDTWEHMEIDNRHYTATTRLHLEQHDRAFPLCMHRLYVPATPLQDDEHLIAIKVRAARLGDGLKEVGMPDLTRPEVTDYFASRIYTQLARIGHEHGLAETPVFQDEVTFYSPLPWNDNIAQALREKWGTKWTANLLALHDRRIDGWEFIRYAYRRLCADLLEKNWYLKIKEYCHTNGMTMTGHLPGEESISAHAQLMGDAFKNLAHFDIPGYDIISSTLPDDIDRSHATGIKLVQSVGWIEHQKPTMVEAFGANGFHQDLQRNRTVLAWLAIHDLKQVCDHATFADPRSMAKYDAPPVHNQFNPMHPGMPDLWNWFRWLCDLLDQYQFNPQTLVLFPYDALTRYTLWEKDWADETCLLESFFHYLCAYSLDCAFLPSHLLHEVTHDKAGFHLRGHTYRHFIVPPFQSLHESTFQGLERLRNQPGFSWILPQDKKGILIFGEENPKSTFTEITAHRVKNCTEDELVETGAHWFADIWNSPLHDINSARSLIRSLRVDPQTQQQLLVLINPHDEAIEITAPHLGDPLAQPPEQLAIEAEQTKHGVKVLLAPRATAVFQYDANGAAPSASTTIDASRLRWRMRGENFLRLQTGTLQLAEEQSVAFAPGAAQKIDESFSTFAKPIAYEATFPLELEESLEQLALILDRDSMPAGAQWFWDDTLLHSTPRDVFATANTAYAIPAPLLTAGAHQLRMTSTINAPTQGILEYPVLQGDFRIATETPLALTSASSEWQDAKSTFPLWQEIGYPQAFGPADYHVEFEVDTLDCTDALLKLPPCIGVLEVAVNGESFGRSNWEPRVLRVPKVLLREGKNEVRLTLYGSWNNIFSRLNYRVNGLQQPPVLRLQSMAVTDAT